MQGLMLVIIDATIRCVASKIKCRFVIDAALDRARRREQHNHIVAMGIIMAVI
jgi:hypothetical protein